MDAKKKLGDILPQRRKRKAIKDSLNPAPLFESCGITVKVQKEGLQLKTNALLKEQGREYFIAWMIVHGLAATRKHGSVRARVKAFMTEHKLTEEDIALDTLEKMYKRKVRNLKDIARLMQRSYFKHSDKWRA